MGMNALCVGFFMISFIKLMLAVVARWVASKAPTNIFIYLTVVFAVCFGVSSAALQVQKKNLFSSYYLQTIFNGETF